MQRIRLGTRGPAWSQKFNTASTNTVCDRTGAWTALKPLLNGLEAAGADGGVCAVENGGSAGARGFAAGASRDVCGRTESGDFAGLIPPTQLCFVIWCALEAKTLQDPLRTPQ
ncbi:uncharacterized protein ASCRUDRAFT_68272 [Ascoidea rubescens DSM 1968]|uniref:Uncharacterized protein n=1 Tax=Ascoidea rubescens DSM 1968 TaxID=1344418 RepID=A0A1D2VRN5_9ASCO|nr:hypothetical protein ASCRUDRAFT_68272 [Ascoidea rubescens DSM 1968]ODV64271.1 hypothetical protein ASCRUDRAFT_68272 [Ascoidea rubescens DSM 1968]